MNSFLLLFPPPKKCTHEETTKKVVQVLASIPLRDDACQHSNKLLLTAPFTFASIVIKRGHGDFLEQPIYIADANLFFFQRVECGENYYTSSSSMQNIWFLLLPSFFEGNASLFANLLRLSVKLQLVLLEKAWNISIWKRGSCSIGLILHAAQNRKMCVNWQLSKH